jgi:hypothetical protein
LDRIASSVTGMLDSHILAFNFGLTSAYRPSGEAGWPQTLSLQGRDVEGISGVPDD